MPTAADFNRTYGYGPKGERIDNVQWFGRGAGRDQRHVIAITVVVLHPRRSITASVDLLLLEVMLTWRPGTCCEERPAKRTDPKCFSPPSIFGLLRISASNHWKSEFNKISPRTLQRVWPCSTWRRTPKPISYCSLDNILKSNYHDAVVASSLCCACRRYTCHGQRSNSHVLGC